MAGVTLMCNILWQGNIATCTALQPHLISAGSICSKSPCRCNGVCTGNGFLCVSLGYPHGFAVLRRSVIDGYPSLPRTSGETEETESAEPMELEIIGTDELAANDNEQASAVLRARRAVIPIDNARVVLGCTPRGPNCTKVHAMSWHHLSMQSPPMRTVPATVTGDFVDNSGVRRQFSRQRTG